MSKADSSARRGNWRRCRRLCAHLPFLLLLLAAIYNVFGGLLDGYCDHAHDGTFNGLRIAEVQEEIAAGYIPPQLLNSAFYGAGHAFPVFYPPLSLWITALIATLAGSVILGVNLSMFGSVVASALSMYAFAYSASRQRLAALASALCYTMANYRLVDTHLRGALAESWSFFWYPLVLLGIWRLLQGRRPGLVLPLGIAGAALTHTITLLYFLFFLIPIGFALWRAQGFRGLIALAIPCALSTGLSAFYLLPMMRWLPGVLASVPEYMLAGWDAVVANSIPPTKLLFGTMPVAEGPEYDFRIGPQLAGALLVACWPFLTGSRPARWIGTPRARFALAALVCCVLYTLFAVAPGLFRFLPERFSYVQFPWRVVGLAILMVSSFVAVGAPLLRRHPKSGYVWIGLSALYILSPSGELRFRDYDMGITEASYTKEERASSFYAGIGYTVLGEYAPISFVRDPKSGMRPSGKPKLKVVEGSVTSIDFRQPTIGSALLTVEAPRPARIRVPLMWYPFWRAESAPGIPVTLRPAGGLIELAVPPGKSQVRLTRYYPPVQIVGACISILSIIVCVGTALGRNRVGGSTAAPVPSPRLP